ncbi:hypothetical protein A2Z23_02950 [Candidatus Curtissbacteria bacterium RBG_16_39_7]|uniref:Uncharacterized protein n=1 Tax=Candidatus Curtissbacteria bacterium RBG_16_39_7 TaxID=1797707 RepID=A0A1F5G3V8_9BACT|nr:MAG: hypothetical protein A2Z23_02950 [Candidatus Curtissbacteria bacterium RBG_16_39_7]
MQDKFGLLLPNSQFLSKDGKIIFFPKTSFKPTFDKRRIEKKAGRNTRVLLFKFFSRYLSQRPLLPHNSRDRISKTIGFINHLFRNRFTY